MKDDTVRFRRGRSHDAKGIAKLIRGARIGELTAAQVTPQRYWIAEVDGRIVGCAKLDFHGREVAILNNCAVHKEYRRQGIGGAFIAMRLMEARRRGKKIAALCTMYYHFRHYKKFGFRTQPRAKLTESVRSYPKFTAKRYMKCAVMTLAL